MTDIALTVNGDYIVDTDGDLVYVSGDAALQQAILFRMKTVRGDWILSPKVGVDLEQFIGAPSNPTTYQKVVDVVTSELNNIIELPSFTVMVAPQNGTSIWILIEFSSTEIPKTTVQSIFDLDLKTGLVYPRQ